MTENDPLTNSPLGAQFRAAHQALLALAPPGTLAAGDDNYLPIIVNELQDLVDLARDTAAANFGPTLGWRRPDPVDDAWAPTVLQLDFDSYADDDPPGVSEIWNWEQSALALAARAYRRECRWDHSPGEAGIWLLYIMPFASIDTSWSGSLAGFAIIHDRDTDGEHESLAHLWTARAWRRRGVGATLVEEARARFPLRDVEGPITDAGRRLLAVHAPDLLV
ncbi:GNAT family N-acetyltransferase [Nocardioides sp. 1609]|uniref:GNAT family N-acetyltransferase n=1 Tax=Nocardioides sp. 1609 TaxID=2508327 RepID=UPI00106F5F31|nr:GNAT family N-acetyltransferase [Nocardioides sp. 1609]